VRASPGCVPPCVYAAVEGTTDEAVLRRLLAECHLPEPIVYGKQGKAAIHKQIRSYNAAARHAPWIVMIDLDSEADCAPELVSDWLPASADLMHLRVAVHAVESWLLADAQRISKFLGVPLSRVPTNPDTLPDPKLTLINLARRSRSRALREDMAPRPESGRSVGPAYVSRLIEFTTDAADGWRAMTAAQVSPSLRGCVHRLRALAESMNKR
jgi:hypothetical protein